MLVVKGIRGKGEEARPLSASCSIPTSAISAREECFVVLLNRWCVERRGQLFSQLNGGIVVGLRNEDRCHSSMPPINEWALRVFSQ